MKRKQWVQLGLVASSMVMLTGCYQRYQRQSSPKKEAATSQTSTKKQTGIIVCYLLFSLVSLLRSGLLQPLFWDWTGVGIFGNILLT